MPEKKEEHNKEEAKNEEAPADANKAEEEITPGFEVQTEEKKEPRESTSAPQELPTVFLHNKNRLEKLPTHRFMSKHQD